MRWVTASVGCVLILAACSSSAPADPPRQVTTIQVAASPQATPAAVQALQPPAPGQGGPVVHPIASPSPLVLPLSVLAGRSGADVRITLNLLLQEQVFLIAQAMDAATSARLDELIGASNTLDQNSITFAEVIGAVKDQSTAQALLYAWRASVADLIAYTQGQQATASADLEQRRPIIAAQVALPGFSAGEADAVLQTRFQAQLGLADAIISHDAARSTVRLHSTLAASDDLAKPLAQGIAARVPDQAPEPTEGLDIDVRLALTRAFEAHSYLTGAATDAAADGRTTDLQALVAATDDNATDVGTQLHDVYGAQVGDGLADRLRAETSAMVSSASGGDRRQAAVDLDRLRSEIDTLLSGANALLPPGLLKQELRASDQPLLTASDAFVARDYTTAFVRLRESARQSQKAADSLALSIVDRYPGRYFVLATPTASP